MDADENLPIMLLPEDAEAHANLGSTLVKLERYEEAESTLRAERYELIPGSQWPTWISRMRTRPEADEHDPETKEVLRRSLSLGADPAEAGEDLRHTSLLFLLSHNPALDGGFAFRRALPGRNGWGHLAREHPGCGTRTWPRPGSHAAHQFRFCTENCNHRDYRQLPRARPVAVDSRRSDLELRAYYNNPSEDAVTQRLRGYMQHWTPVSALPDRQMARKITDDRIDILLDLSGHTSLNRLRVFARKPAPIQVWLDVTAKLQDRTSRDGLLPGGPALASAAVFRSTLHQKKLVYLCWRADFSPTHGCA